MKIDYLATSIDNFSLYLHQNMPPVTRVTGGDELPKAR